jgi:hypothetical protein
LFSATIFSCEQETILPSFSTEMINETWTGYPKLACDYAERDCSRKHAQKVDKVFHSDIFNIFFQSDNFYLFNSLSLAFVSESHSIAARPFVCTWIYTYLDSQRRVLGPLATIRHASIGRGGHCYLQLLEIF